MKALIKILKRLRDSLLRESKFDLQVLAAVDFLQNAHIDPYGVSIAERLQHQLGEDPNRGKVYGSLGFLEYKGLLTAEMKPRQGSDRDKRVYSITKAGRERLLA